MVESVVVVAAGSIDQRDEELGKTRPENVQWWTLLLLLLLCKRVVFLWLLLLLRKMKFWKTRSLPTISEHYYSGSKSHFFY
jgi:hypothetical protein